MLMENELQHNFMPEITLSRSIDYTCKNGPFPRHIHLYHDPQEKVVDDGHPKAETQFLYEINRLVIPGPFNYHTTFKPTGWGQIRLSAI